jgi:hypothetical protein
MEAPRYNSTVQFFNDENEPAEAEVLILTCIVSGELLAGSEEQTGLEGAVKQVENSTKEDKTNNKKKEKNIPTNDHTVSKRSEKGSPK